MPVKPQYLEHAIALCLAEGGGAPDWVAVLPPGPDLVGIDGRKWKLSNAQALVTALNAVALDRPIDINHSTELLAAKGQESPALGWLKAGTFRVALNGEIEAQAEWTPRGKATLEAREYRYVSPAIRFANPDKEVVGILSLALVPRPNLTNLPALNAPQPESEMTKEQLTALCAALNLAADSEPDTIITTAKKLQTDHTTALNAAKPDLNQFVPRADYQVALNRAQDAEQKLVEKEKVALNAAATALIDEAVKDGKIAPASKAFYVGLCSDQSGLDNVKTFLGSAPKIIADSQAPTAQPAGQGTALNAAQLEVGTAFGLSAEELKKQLEADTAKA